MYICQCRPGFTGSACSQPTSACDSSPCFNGATCLSMSSLNSSFSSFNPFTCLCVASFTGSRCELELDGCALRPCQNGGECLEGPVKYACRCPPGTLGLHCEQDIDECSSQPCRNGALCTTPRLNMYTCSCPPQFRGVNCETPINSCLNFPCLNNGVCTLSAPSQLFVCSCPIGFTGDRCQTSIVILNRTFTDQTLNVYGLMKFLDFNSFSSCISSSWGYLNPQIPASSVRLNLQQAKSSLEFTGSILANITTSMTYTAVYSNIPASLPVRAPSASEYAQFCPNIVLLNNRIVTYSQYWDLSVCGRISSPSDFELIRIKLVQLWSKKMPEVNAACQCLNVQLITALTQYSTGPQNNASRIFYLVYANSLQRIIEKGQVNYFIILFFIFCPQRTQSNIGFVCL